LGGLARSLTRLRGFMRPVLVVRQQGEAVSAPAICSGGLYPKIPTRIVTPRQPHRRALPRHLSNVMSDERSAPIRIVRPEQFSGDTQQTPGSLRLAAISATQDVQSRLWAGLFVVEPGAKTGIHHHGSQDTIVYILDGESYVRWGEHGEHSAIARAGDFVHVPAWLPHQEINPSQSDSFRWVVVRSTPEPIVVNLPEEFWD
jgi:uncharacterized RmlC-like cupin family protein